MFLLAAALTLQLYSVNTAEAKTDLDYTWNLEFTPGTSLEVASDPAFMGINWYYGGGSGRVYGYLDGVVHLRLETTSDRSGRLIAQIDAPNRLPWFPEPVVVDWALDEGEWTWRFPKPPNDAQSLYVLTNPDELEVRLTGALPEPSALWLLLLGIASVVSSRRLGRGSAIVPLCSGHLARH